MSRNYTLENYCFSKLAEYKSECYKIFQNWGKEIKVLYKSIHLLDHFEDFVIFFIMNENLVDYFRFSEDLKKDRFSLILSKTKLQPIIGQFFEVAKVGKGVTKKNFKDSFPIGNIYCVPKDLLHSYDYKAVLCKQPFNTKEKSEEVRKKRQFELIPELFCFHTRDKTKQILVFTGLKSNDNNPE